MDMYRKAQSSGQMQIEAVVKWYNATKGYGFVQPANGPENGGGDIFLHASVVRQAGRSEIAPGARVVCDIAEGPRGQQVAAIHSVTGGEAAFQGNGFQDNGRAPSGPTSEIEGRIKFYDPARGFGFVVPDQGGQDVFVSVRQVEQAGVATLTPEQRVRVTASSGRKGPVAVSLKVI